MTCHFIKSTVTNQVIKRKQSIDFSTFDSQKSENQRERERVRMTIMQYLLNFSAFYYFGWTSAVTIDGGDRVSDERRRGSVSGPDDSSSSLSSV
ncbi:hypothetical protein Ddye_013278 [Dipteronia dyeriana]|uniref:Uncharacterized protein n=1 Tax=Dipteronia dyeriana TaxID=168575 RepID=A0AAD9X651_9ROSI|nr:hypothetical protein Ddye_013278 [Dipteronia dyeriana]